MNPLVELKALFPSAGKIIATVVAESPDGTTLCTTLAGGSIKVSGANGRTPGSKVFVVVDPKIGLYILGPAPALPSYDIEIF